MLGNKFLTLLILLFLTSCGVAEKSSSGDVLHLIQTIPLPNVEGRIDHLSVDVKGQRLFVAALGNNTVEIIDLKMGKVINSLSGLSEPQSALFIPSLNKIYVTNGGNGLCQVFDGSSFAELGQIQLSSDADNIRYDSKTGSVVVGYGDGGLSFIDANNGKVMTNIKLSGHPESFQLESLGSRIFVNIPSANQVAVVDREKEQVIYTWFMTNALANFPMAMDENDHRLFVGFRAPARLVIFDTETGKSIANLTSVGDVDDIFYDEVHKLIFVIGGEGYVDIFSQSDDDHYELLARGSTANGARTGLWAPELNRLYVAVPDDGKQEAEIRIYDLQN